MSVFYIYDPASNVVSRWNSNGYVVSDQPFPFGTQYNVYFGSDFTTLYDSFGTQLGQISIYTNHPYTSPDPVGFGGQWGYYTDNETAPVNTVTSSIRQPIVLCGHRYYDPSIGRFLTRDPIGYEGGINLYSYCDNNPINYADPSGTWDFTINGFDGKPFLVFSSGGTKAGLKTGTAVVADTLSFGIYSSKAYKNDPGYTGSGYLALAGRELLIQAATLGSSNYFTAVRAAKVSAIAASKATAAAGNVLVYQSVNAAKEITYVGITNNIVRRGAQQFAQKGIDIVAIPGLSNLTRAQARSVEQVLIEKYGIGKGGTLINKINSIAKTNKIYADSLKEGAQLLHKAGYAGF